MLNKEAIEKVQEALAVEQLSAIISESMSKAASLPVAVPASMNVVDLQKYMPNRRRMAGEMETTDPDAFAAYCIAHAENGSAVFVNPEQMSACAVLNFGTTGAPGHADNTATLNLVKSAQYKALLRITDTGKINQRAMAEFLEDNAQHIRCFADTEEIRTPLAIAAIRNVNIEQLSKTESTVEQLSQQASTFEQIKATSKHVLPTLIYFECTPYLGLPARTFVCRLGIHTGDDAPRITLRIINHELHQQEMADEACVLLTGKFNSQCPVYVGTYEKQ